MFPITENYIEREYTIAKNHLILTSERTAKKIEQKAKKIIGIINRGKKLLPTQINTSEIIKKLKEKM